MFVFARRNYFYLVQKTVACRVCQVRTSYKKRLFNLFANVFLATACDSCVCCNKKQV